MCFKVSRWLKPLCAQLIATKTRESILLAADAGPKESCVALYPTVFIHVDECNQRPTSQLSYSSILNAVLIYKCNCPRRFMANTGFYPTM